MHDPPSGPDRSEIPDLLERFRQVARRYLDELDERPLLAEGWEAALDALDGPLPEMGTGALAAFEELARHGITASAATSGPRCFHFVIGGATPAAQAADWLATTLDQIAYASASSPLGVELEVTCLRWLKDLFGLPQAWSGVFTTGATMSNFVCLAAARQWWGERHGVDVSEQGMQGLPPVAVFTSGHVHASSLKVLALLGVGRGNVRRLAADATGRLDVEALRRSLAQLEGRPAILIGNAGEVNAGEFDPIDTLADLAQEHDAWLHVDGAFGLFARLSPRTAHLARGVERARSVTVDGHKWLNVPYDCGFAFVDDVALLGKAFAYTAAYLPGPDDPRPAPGAIGPESSRRARSLSVWATLAAYGREGYRRLVERHLDLAQHLARGVDAAADLERLAEVPLNVVCFRFDPGGLDEAALNELNQRLGKAILADGRIFVGTTDYGGRVALRPAIANWRTRESDVDQLLEVVREISRSLVP